MRRLTRAEQVEQNRERVLAAARRVFMARGYAGASLEAIADDAGFSKGVVYSQFESKADLFLALLDRRIAERARRNEAIAATGAGGAEGLRDLLETAERMMLREPDWTLLVLEFRTHAARDPELNRRYAEAHARTIAGIAHVLARLFERAGLAPDVPFESLAELILAIDSGVALERVARPNALPTAQLAHLMFRALGVDPAVAAELRRA